MSYNLLKASPFSMNSAVPSIATTPFKPILVLLYNSEKAVKGIRLPSRKSKPMTPQRDVVGKWINYGRKQI